MSGLRADETLCLLNVEGNDFDFFTDYTCSSGMFDVADPFEFHAPIPAFYEKKNRVVELLHDTKEGAVVRVFIRPRRDASGYPDKTLQYTGRIDSVEIRATRDGGSVMSVTGRSHMAQVVDSCLMPGMQLENCTLADVAKVVLAKWYSLDKIVVSNDANRLLLTGVSPRGSDKSLAKKSARQIEELKVDVARPHSGETAFAFLERHARRFGLMIWGTCDGKVVLGAPNYEQSPIYDIQCGESSNTKAWSFRRSMRSRPSEIHVYGRTHGHDFGTSPVHAELIDKDVKASGYDRLLVIHDHQARTKEQAMQRAHLEASKRKIDANRLTLTMPDHIDYLSGCIWAIDTVAKVTWPEAGMQAEKRHIIKRTFTRSRHAGTQTTIETTPLNAITIGD